MKITSNEQLQLLACKVLICIDIATYWSFNFKVIINFSIKKLKFMRHFRIFVIKQYKIFIK